jgi:hypothetical protein
MEFFTGLVVGLFVGATVGFLFAAVLIVGKFEDIRRGYEQDSPRMDRQDR